MSANQWVYEIATGQFYLGEVFDPSIYLTDQINYALADLGEGASIPDPRTERYDGASPTKRRAATPTEITAYDDAAKDVSAISIDDDKLIQAVAQVDFEERQKLQVKAGQTLLTAQQTKARIRTIYRGLL